MTRLPLPQLPSPLGPINPLARSVGRRQQQPLSPEEEDSILRKLGRTTVSGIGAVGNLLDLPGSMVRDVASSVQQGKFVNPFDQLLSPFSAENRVTGRDLLRQGGMVGQEDTWGNFGGGLGAEILLDPLTYLTFGTSAVSKAGKALKMAGGLDDIAEIATKQLGRRVGAREARKTLTLGDVFQQASPELQTEIGRSAQKLGSSVPDLASQKLGGSFGVGLPFRDPMAVGNLPMAASRAGDIAGEALRYGKYSPIRPLVGAFSPANKGMVSASGQRMAQKVFRAEEAATEQARSKVASFADQLESSGHLDVDSIARSQNVPRPAAAKTVAQRSMEINDYLEGRGQWTGPPQLQAELDNVRQMLDDQLLLEKDAGLDIFELDDLFAKYVPRQLYQFSVPSRGVRGSSRLYQTTHSFQQGRREFLKNHPGGTRILQEMSLDPNISGFANLGDRAGKLRPGDAKNLGQYIKGRYGTQLGPDTNFDQLATWLAHLDPKHVKNGVPAFELNPLRSVLSRMEHGARAVKGVEGAMDLIRDTVTQDFTDAKALNKIMDDMKLSDEAKVRMAEELTGSQFADVASADKALHDFYIPDEIANDATRFVRSFSSADAVTALGNAFDKVTNLYKVNLTSFWPAFHTRNLVSALYQNWIGGALSGTSLASAFRLMTGRGIPGTSAAEVSRLRRLAFSHGVIGHRMGQMDEVLGQAVSPPSNLGTPNRKSGVLEQVFTPAPPGTPLRSQFNPLRVSGVVGEEDVFAPARFGRNTAHMVEGVVRLTGFLELMRKGHSPAAAARRVKALQVDYTVRAPADKYMRRLFPFWTFTKGMVPVTVEELGQRPGGKLGRTITTAGRQRDENEILPDYVSQTAAIPHGPIDEEGTLRFTTGFGLPFEDVASFASDPTRPGAAIRNMGLEVLSRMNPMIKGPVEWSSGVSAFQRGPMGGRELADMTPTYGRMASNIRELAGGEKERYPGPIAGSDFLESMLSNLPTARLGTTARTLTDPRKLEAPSAMLLNLLTGVRQTDISPAAQEAVLRETAEDFQRQFLGGRRFERTWIPDEALERMSPEDRIIAGQFERLMATLSRRQRERSRK